MSAERRLSVSTDDRAVGVLIEQNDRWSFEYDNDWRHAPDAFPLSPLLSLSQQLHRDGSTYRSVQWYFDNLLPEESLRDVLSKEQGVDVTDAFGLLDKLGAESAGSLVLVSPEHTQVDKGDLPLGAEDLSDRIRNLPRASLTSRSPKRMSLAGAQHKMVVLFDSKTGALSEPLKDSASSHILKPNGTSEAYPHSVVNETFTMRLASRLRLTVPAVYRLYVPEPVYIVERFDRQWDADLREWKRQHVLDACQLLNQPRMFKYSNANLDTLVQLIEMCRAKAVARMAIFRWILFNTLIGNSDSHLKNISFLINAEGVRVAPSYDLLCTAVYHTPMYADGDAVWPAEPLAIPIVGANVFGEVTRQKLVDTGIRLGLAASAANRETQQMIRDLADAADQSIKQMEEEFIAIASKSSQVDAMRALQGAESHLLRGVRHIIIADMLNRVR